MEPLNNPSSRRMPKSSTLKHMDYSLRSPYGPPHRRSTRSALLSGMRRDDDLVVNQRFAKLKLDPRGKTVTRPTHGLHQPIMTI